MRHRLIAAVLLVLAASACGGDTVDVGEAGDAAEATRTVEVRALETRRFEPAGLQVKPGETVTLRVTNTATTLHEFFLGDAEAHEDHDKEMAAMGDAEMKMADEANRVFVEPGETKELTWTFPEGGAVLFGCHMPGHYAGGMKGTVSVAE